MEKTFRDQTAENLNEKLATYKDLLARKQALQERLTKTEEKRHSVAEKIYRKVREDYEVQLSKLDTELTPIEKDVAETRQAITEQLGEVEKALETLGEELSEAEFRHVVGEHKKHDFETIEQRISPEINEKRKMKKKLSNLLDRFESTADSPNAESGGEAVDRTGKLEGDDAFSALADPLDEGSDIPQAESQKASPSTPSEGESAGEPPSNPPGNKAQSRIEKDSAEETPPEPAAAPTVDTGEGESAEDTPLGPHEAQDVAKAAHRQTKETPITFPNLIILTGAHSGKKIPLLPMTMTIGREHDNHIEIKDEDVTRYHARIVYRDGDFILQDMNSSTGTWVNGDQVTEVTLKNSDKICFGKTEMIIDFS